MPWRRKEGSRRGKREERGKGEKEGGGGGREKERFGIACHAMRRDGG